MEIPLGSRCDPRSLGIRGPVRVDDGAALFLDDQMKAAAHRLADEAFAVRDPLDLRLAGFICDETHDAGRPTLGLLYVAKLRQPGIAVRTPRIEQMCLCGHVDLLQQRDQFDGWSRIVIDNLAAL
jgi:predicted NUDIX family phosphoesterase